MKINEGTVVITGTGQAGTYIGDSADGAVVFLANGDFWYGHSGQMRIPQDAEDLAACPLNVDRFEAREKSPLVKQQASRKTRYDD